MKRFFCVILAALAACCAVSLSGCGDKGSAAPDTAATAAEETTQITPVYADDSADGDGNEKFSELLELHKINYEGDKLAGAWTITEGVGSKLKSFVFLFDGSSKHSYLMCGSMGYIAAYKLDGNTLEAEMMFGLNGNYNCEFSDDGMTATLTNTKTNDTTTMQKIVSYDYIPMPPAEKKIDEKLIGAWKDPDNEFLYFDENGIMYQTQEGVSFTFYTYSAQNGKLRLTYNMPDEISETKDYKLSGDKLTLDSYDYERISPDELK